LRLCVIGAVNNQAMAKVDVPLLAAHFIDFLGLLIYTHYKGGGIAT
tara:strand:- start:139 stop:276 length:138 start_codon:yes stop_codon:yes gene_type:complete